MLSILDEWKKYQDDANSNENAFVPIVSDIGETKCFFQTKVDDTNNDTMKTEDNECADGDGCNNVGFDVVDRAEKINETVNGKQVDDIIENNMKQETVFVDMTIENNEAQKQGRDADKKILCRAYFSEPVHLTKQIAHEEKTYTSDKSVICQIWRIVIIFVSTIEYDTDNGYDKHQNLSMFLAIADVCNQLHYKQCNQEPGYPIQFA